MSYCKKLCNSNSMDVNVVLCCTCCKAVDTIEHYKYTLMYVHLSNGRQTLDHH